MLRYVILGLLRAGAGHGWALVKAVRACLRTDIPSACVYRDLGWLAGKGWIEADGNRAGPGLRRASYRITAAGIWAFDAWHLNPRMRLAAQCGDELSAQAMFVRRGEAAAIDTALRAWREVLWARSRALERQYSSARESPRGDDEFWARPRMIELRQGYVTAELRFLDGLRQDYEALQAAKAPAGADTQTGAGAAGEAPTRSATVARESPAAARRQPSGQRVKARAHKDGERSATP